MSTMTMRVFLKSGEHFDIPNADWEKLFKMLDEAVEKAKIVNAKMNNMVLHNDTFPLFLQLEQIAAIAPVL